MRQRYPQVEGLVGDLQTMDLEALGSFDVVHCLGLLYRPTVPSRRCVGSPVCAAASWCSRPSSVTPTGGSCSSRMKMGSANQALAGLGCRPSPSFVAMALDRLGFAYMYGTTMPPQHPDFLFEWRNNRDARRDGANLRCMFVASRTPVACDHLRLLLPSQSAR